MNNSVKLVVSVIVIALSVFVVVRSTRPPKGSAANHEYAGAAAGRELARLAGDKGGKILVVGFADDRRVMNQQIDGFLAEIKKNPAFEFLGREDIDPQARGPGEIMEGGGVPPAAFGGCLAGHRDADIVVSFVGLPDLRDPRTSARLAGGLKLVVLNARSAELPDLVRRGTVYLAVVSKAVDMAQFTEKPASPEAWFDRFFEIVSAATAAGAK